MLSSGEGETFLDLLGATELCLFLKAPLSILSSELFIFLIFYETRLISKKPLNGRPLTEEGIGD